MGTSPGGSGERAKVLPFREVVFCADDLGASRGVNQGILEAYFHGPVRRASVLAVGFALEDAARAVRTAPDLEVGLHFSLSLGRPLSPGGKTLAGEKGFFLPLEKILVRSLLGFLDPGAVREEMEAQWEALLRAGLSPTYLDGHQHVHLFPGVREALDGFLADHKVGRVRLLGEALHFPPRRRLLPRLLLARFSRRAAPALRARGVLREERAIGLCLWQAPDLEETLKTLLSGIPPGRWEVFTHPRRPDGDFETLDPESRKGPDPGRRELALLTDPGFLAWLESRGLLPPPPRGSAPSSPTTG